MKYFPYPKARIGQQQLASATYDTIVGGGHVVVEGPNGMGKTAALLSAVLASMENSDRTVFDYSKTHRQNENVLNELARITNLKPHPTLFAVEIRGRASLCCNSQLSTTVDDDLRNLCAAARESGMCRHHLNAFRQRPAIERSTHGASILASDSIRRLSRAYEACPYDVDRSIALGRANLVILTYPYFVNRFLRGTILSRIPRGNEKAAVLDECVGADSLVDTPTGPIPMFKLARKSASILTAVYRANYMSLGALDAKCLGRGQSQPKASLRIRFSDGHELSLSDRTPLCFHDPIAENLYWRSASDIRLGDEVLACDTYSDFRTVSVEDISSDEHHDMYDVVVPRYHNFIANGVVVHNSHNLFSSLVEDNTTRITTQDLRRALLEAVAYDDEFSQIMIRRISAAMECFRRPPEREIPSKELLGCLTQALGGLEPVIAFKEFARRARLILNATLANGGTTNPRMCKVASFLQELTSIGSSPDYSPLFFRDDRGTGLELLFSSPT